MAQRNNNQDPAHNTNKPEPRNRKRGIEAEDSETKRSKLVKKHDISADLQVILGRIYTEKTSPEKCIALTKELENLYAVVKPEGKLSVQLQAIMERYISPGDVFHHSNLSQLARSYQIHQTYTKRLQYMALTLKDGGNKEIVDLMQMHIDEESCNVRDRGIKLYERDNHNQQPGEQSLNLAQDNQNDTQISQESERIQALLKGRWFVESSDQVIPLNEIFEHIQERNSKARTPLEIEIEFFQHHIKLEGEHERWGRRLLNITQEQVKASLDQGQNSPYNSIKLSMESSKQYANQSEDLENMEHALRIDENKRIADHMRRYVNQRIRLTLKSARAKDKAHHIVDNKTNELMSIPEEGKDTFAFKKACQELEEIKMFLARDHESPEAVAFTQIVRAKKEIEDHLARKQAGMHNEEQLAFMEETDTLVDKHNSLCKQFKEASPQKVNELRYSLEELDVVSLWKRK